MGETIPSGGSPRKRGLWGGNTPGRSKSATALVAIVSLIASSFVVLSAAGGITPAPAQATVPGQPGTAQAPLTLYTEGFENGTDTNTILANAYVGAGGNAFTTDPSYITGCNGLISEWNSVPVTTTSPFYTGCNANSNLYVNDLEQSDWALGTFNGVDPTTNHAWGMESLNNPTGTVIQTANVLTVPSTTNGRFLVFGMDTAAAFACTSPTPQFQLSAVQGTTVTPVAGNLGVCGSGATTIPVAARGGRAATSLQVRRVTTTGSILSTGGTYGYRVTNASAGSSGNDGAFDNVRILDGTPQLDKSFSPTSVAVGGTSVLTFTVTNTTDLASKAGWKFTDALPAGLVVAPTPAASTTCTSTTITAVAGSTSISVPSGTIASGVTSCTIKVNVTSATTNTYVNGPGNITTISGLNPPGNANVTFGTPVVNLAVVKTANLTGYVAGSPLTYTVVVRNPAPSATAVGATVSDPLPTALAGAGFTWTCAASAGASCTASGSGNITDTVTIPSNGTVTYTVTGTVPAATTGTLSNTATVTPPTGTSDTGCSPNCSSTVSVPAVPPNPALTVTKTASPASVTTAGTVVTFSVTAANTGNTTMTDVAVTDPLPGLSAITYGPWPEGTEGLLLSGESVTATATWTVTQASVTAGSVSNTAVVSGDPPTGTFTPRSSNTVTITTNKPAAPDSLLPNTGGSGLAFTGSDPAGPMAVAFLLLLFGTTFFTISIRRRKTRG